MLLRQVMVRDVAQLISLARRNPSTHGSVLGRVHDAAARPVSWRDRTVLPLTLNGAEVAHELAALKQEPDEVFGEHAAGL